MNSHFRTDATLFRWTIHWINNPLFIGIIFSAEAALSSRLKVVHWSLPGFNNLFIYNSWSMTTQKQNSPENLICMIIWPIKFMKCKFDAIYIKVIPHFFCPYSVIACWSPKGFVCRKAVTFSHVSDHHMCIWYTRHHDEHFIIIKFKNSVHYQI